jgi:hypothetical protein
MSDEWFTYSQAAERLNTTVEGVRLRALRGRWQKTIGNDKRPHIRLPEGWSNDVQTTVARRERKAKNAVRSAVDEQLIKSLEAHVTTLREQLAAVETRLSAADASLASEQERTTRAISAFESLAERLEAVAAERAKPWWRRLTG